MFVIHAKYLEAQTAQVDSFHLFVNLIATSRKSVASS